MLSQLINSKQKPTATNRILPYFMPPSLQTQYQQAFDRSLKVYSKTFIIVRGFPSNYSLIVVSL